MKPIFLLFYFFAICISAFSQAPTITSFSPAYGPVGTLVTVLGTNLSNPNTFTIGGVPAIVVSNTGASLVGMVMPGAVSGGISIGTSGGTTTSNRIFIVTSVPFQGVQQGGKLLGSNNSRAWMGNAVAISADGTTAIVGGDQDSLIPFGASYAGIGAAWVFTRIGNSWVQQGPKLVGTGFIGASQQGTSVALSADGNTAIVGGILDNNTVGAAWIFVRSGGIWTQQGNKLTGDSTYGGFGSSVALSSDGNTALIGKFGTLGATWVYVRSGNSWIQQGPPLVGLGGIGTTQWQGYSAALSADGNTALIGAPYNNGSTGGAWVFTRIAGTWSQQGSVLVGTGNAGQSNQGWSVFLSEDGNTAIIGAISDNHDTGAAWIFTRYGNSWTQQGNKLVGSGSVGHSDQGSSVSISADGSIAIVGGEYDSTLETGAIWIYRRSNGIWMQQGVKLVGTEGHGAYQGSAVAISADGNTIIEGGRAAVDSIGVGAAWIFVNCATVSVTETNICSDAIPYTWNGLTLTGPGIQTKGLLNIAGCDSAAYLNLGVNPMPNVTWVQTDTVWCPQHGMHTPSIKGGRPSGGTYGGSFVIGDTIIYAPYGRDTSFNVTYSYVDSNGCQSSVSHQFTLQQCDVGIAELTNNPSIHLYPNPNKGSFTLETSGSINSEYTISDMLGHFIAQQFIRSDSQQMDLADSAEGVYTLTVRGAQPIRFVIVR